MLKKFLTVLTDRGDNENEQQQRSGIIVVSSAMAKVAMPADAIYAASKAYMSHLVQGVSHELAVTGKERIDTQLLCPGFIQTTMLTGVYAILSFLTVASVQSVVSSSLRQLGHKKLPGETIVTGGTFLHDIKLKVSEFLF